MYRIFGMVVLLLALTAGVAHAESRGKRFYDGLQNPSELAALMERNLETEKALRGDQPLKGDMMLDPARCSAPHWSCASPNDYLVVIQKFDPGATVNGERLERVDQLPAFLRKLVIQEPPSGAYWMACMAKAPVTAPTSSGYYPIENCVARHFHKGEKAWADPDTGRVVLAQDCTNPVGKPEQPSGCGDLLIPVQIGDLVLIAGHGPVDITKLNCTGLRRAGEAEFEAVNVERCEHVGCDLNGATAYSYYPEQWTGSFQAEVSGWTVVRVPLEVVRDRSKHQIFVCIHRADGTTFYGLGARWFDYLPGGSSYAPPGDDYVATIQPDYQTAIEKGRITRVKGRISILWWDTDPSHFTPESEQPKDPES